MSTKVKQIKSNIASPIETSLSSEPDNLDSELEKEPQLSVTSPQKPEICWYLASIGFIWRHISLW